MILGKVVGCVWATRKHKRLAKTKLVIVQPYFWYSPPHSVEHVVAVDSIGAGPGEDVLVCLGEPARRKLDDINAPVEASVAAIVDRVQLSAEVRGLKTVSGEPIPKAWL